MKKLTIALLLTLTCVFTTFAQAPQEKSVTVFGAKIRYLEAGDATKPKIVLLHGLGGQAENWSFVIPALAAKYHVIALDQVGFGKSDKPFIKYRVGTFSDFLDKFLTELKIEKATFIGNSLGGWVGSFFAIKYPNRVEKLILANAAGLTPKTLDLQKVYQLQSSTRDEIRANLKLIFANQAYSQNDAMVDNFLLQRVLANDGYTIDSITESIKRNEDFLDKRLGEIKQKTLIIWGRQDGLIPLEDGERFKKGIANSELLVIENCGHVPMVEKFAEFSKAVLEFMQKK
jgi:pimeloyl-ACP methyl ester carboxylesterase